MLLKIQGLFNLPLYGILQGCISLLLRIIGHSKHNPDLIRTVRHQGVDQTTVHLVVNSRGIERLAG